MSPMPHPRSGLPADMKLTVFASGSTGNCALLQGGGVAVLLDAGVSARRMSAALESAGVLPQSLDGIFVTHEHSDHTKGLSVFLKQNPVNVYAPGTVAGYLRRTLPGALPMQIKTLDFECPMTLGDMKITAFPTPHDTPESAGYRLEADGASFALATDTGCVTDTMLRWLVGADAVLIEANHDVAMLKAGNYPLYLKRRILADTGHLSNGECTWLASVLAQRGTGTVILGHISRENNIPGLALRTVRRGLEGTAASILLAPELGKLEVSIEPCCV